MLGCTKCTVKFRVLCRFVHSVLVKLVIRRKQIKISFVHKIALPLYMYMYLFFFFFLSLDTMPVSSVRAREFLGCGSVGFQNSNNLLGT
jgi:hypothetical protein